MARVVLENVTKIYGKDVVAARDVSLEIRDSEFVILVGPSGCGKSTILRMIAGLEEITEGKIFIDDRIINTVPPKDRDIAMVFQNYALYPHMTVYGNMAFGLKMRKVSKAEIDRRVQKAVDILGIQDLLDRKPKALSGGQRQRVAVGRAIVRNPKVFLFDEPLSNLDAKLRVQMRTEISKLHLKIKTTMIYVTHDQVEAMTMGDRIVVLKDGLVQQIDTPLNLYNRPQNKFVAGFIGSPPMNFFDGEIHRENGMWFESGRMKLMIPENYFSSLEAYVDKPVCLGIRPENIDYRIRAKQPLSGADVKATVEVVEPMGNEVYLYASAGEQSFIARLDNQFGGTEGLKINLLFDMANAHFFDLESEQIIAC
jgi:multiple sugar transport system ATP-binding protein